MKYLRCRQSELYHRRSIDLSEFGETMANSDQQDDICRIVSSTMKDFRESMEYSHQMSIRIGRRTTQIIRLGMFSVLILGVVMAYLITTMASDFNRMTEHMTAMSSNMQHMEKHFAAVSKRITSMDATLTNMNSSVYVLPEMASTLGHMNNNTYQMSDDMRSMVGNIGMMRSDVADMSGNLETMDRNVGGMNNAVNDMTGSMRYMNKEMRDMSRPMDFFPFK